MSQEERGFQLRHPYCQNKNCRICMEDHEALEALLIKRTGNDAIDHLGHYHRWLSEHNIEPETEYGWATPESFEQNNINAYVMEKLERD